MSDETLEMQNFLFRLPDGKFSMRISEDNPAFNFPPGFSFRFGGRLFVLFPEDKQAQESMGVSRTEEAP